MYCIKIGAIAIAVAAAGCATMNPYVQHSKGSHSSRIKACSPDIKDSSEGATLNGDPALTYACEMTIRLEKARAQIITTRSSLTATIFPLAGIIGYNSARGFNAPTNTALTAGGFAGYSAISSLAQPDRIRVYDNGLKSIQCAIGTYEVATAGTAQNSVKRIALTMEADRTISLLDATSKTVRSHPKPMQEIERLKSFVRAIRQATEEHRPNKSQEAQLRQFVRITVAKVNSQLTQTIPDNKQLIGGALGIFQPPKDQAEGGEAASMRIDRAAFQSSDKKTLLVGMVDSELDILENALNGLWKSYQQLANDTAALPTMINFERCAYTDINDAGFKGGISPLLLGPNDQFSGGTYPAPFSAVISGGVPPYSATIEHSTTSKPVIVNITTTAGMSHLVATAPDGTPTGSHSIIVSDATNQQAKRVVITVKVP